MIRAATIAFLIGVILTLLNVVLFGGGHGTYVPALFCFGPAFVAVDLTGDFLGVLILGPILYGIYALILSLCRASGRGLLGLLAVLFFHNVFVAWRLVDYEAARLMKWVLNGSVGAGLILLCAAIYFGTVALAIYYTLRLPKTNNP